MTQPTYSQAVTENLAHMGTPAGDWYALPVTGMTETDGPDGQPVTMPTFDFSAVAGYTSAPTLFPAQSGAGGMTNCELCGHPIKNVYHLANDVRHWSMIVGSECVTHFTEGKSGERLTKEAIWQRNRAELRRVKAVVKAFEKSRHCRWMGRAHLPEWYVPQDVRTAYGKLDEATQDLYPDALCRNVEATCDAALTRWANKKGADCATWAALIEQFMQAKP